VEVNRRRAFAAQLWRLADLTRAAERRRSFRAKAYRRAVWSLDHLDPDLEVDDEELLATPGIGPGIAALISEYRSQGRLLRLDLLEASFPTESPRLRRLPRMSPKLLSQLKVSLGVDTSEDLASAIDTGAALSLHGVGDATLELWSRILALAPGPEYVAANDAWEMSRALATHIEEHLNCQVVIAGAVRRLEEWVDAIKLVVVTDKIERVEFFLAESAALAEMVRADGSRMVGRTHDGQRVVADISPPSRAGTVLIAATGPPAHASSVLALGSFATEADAYRADGSPWIAPPARGLPRDAAARVVTVDDLEGDLHIHTEASPDGRMTVGQLMAAAESRGYRYLLITDHTHGLRFGGLGPEALAAQAVELSGTRTSSCLLLHGAEVNIDAGGLLDIDDDTISILDFVVAGVHSHFSLGQVEQTRRLVKALSHPAVRVLAHPLGRRIGIRPPIDIDFPAVVEAAVASSVAFEVNGHRDRLDLPVTWIEVAADAGAVFAANSDAHRLSELSNVENAVASLQRVGVGPERVVNALPLQEFLAWAHK